MMQLSDNVVARLRENMQMPDLTGTRYAIVRYLARGGMGSVWLVEDTVLKRRVALKVLDVVGASDDLPARLLTGGACARKPGTPGIVPVHDAGTLADGRAFYCMKYVEGHTLAEHIVNLNLSDRLRLMERIAEPLDFAHARGFLHRDLKPENIMIGAFGEVLIMDWGLAKVGLVQDPGQPNSRQGRQTVCLAAPVRAVFSALQVSCLPSRHAARVWIIARIFILWVQFCDSC